MANFINGRKPSKRLVIYSLTPLAWCAILAWHFSGLGGLAQGAEKKDDVTEPSKITLTGPKEGVVDRPITFQVQVVNVSGQRTEKRALWFPRATSNGAAACPPLA